MVPGVTGEMTTGEYHPREVRGESTAPQIMRGIAEPARRLRRVRQSAAPKPQAPTGSPGLPKYLRLERKELRMWPDQITNLSILARVLNKNRGGAGERITVNTLIRVATALLLSRSQELEGTTEEELRRSLGLPELQLRTSRAARTRWPALASAGLSPIGRHSPAVCLPWGTSGGVQR